MEPPAAIAGEESLIKHHLSRRAAEWLVSHLVGPNADAMLGDIRERLGDNWSWLRYSKEIAVALLGYHASTPWRIHMKRLILAVVILVAFFLGYYTAQNPYFIHDELPSPEALAKEATVRDAERRALVTLRRERMPLATLDFLQLQLEKYETAYAKTPSAALKVRIDDFRKKREATISSMNAGRFRSLNLRNLECSKDSPDSR